MVAIPFRPHWVNSLWPSDATEHQGSGSTLAQVMACCLTAPSHYLNQCWFIINEVPAYLKFHSNRSGANELRERIASTHTLKLLRMSGSAGRLGWMPGWGSITELIIWVLQQIPCEWPGITQAWDLDVSMISSHRELDMYQKTKALVNWITSAVKLRLYEVVYFWNYFHKAQYINKFFLTWLSHFCISQYRLHIYLYVLRTIL